MWYMKRKLMFGDCLERMKEIPDNSVNMVITSPPYDKLRTYKDSLKWDFEIFQKVANELKRVLKKGGVIVWVVGDAAVKGSETGSSFKQALYFKEIGLNLHDTMIYSKTGPPLSHNRYEQYFEYMFILSKGKPNTFNGIKDKPNKRHGETVTGSQRSGDVSKQLTHAGKRKIAKFGLRGNIWFYDVGKWKTTKDEIAYQHPAIFPDKLAHDHIVSWSNEGDTVLDPMMGSGTTGKQSKLLKRNFIGIECVKEYFKIAKQRIKDA